MISSVHDGSFLLIVRPRLLERIHHDVEKQLRRKPLGCFFHRSSIATLLDDYVDALDSTWRSFDVGVDLGRHVVKCSLRSQTAVCL